MCVCDVYVCTHISEMCVKAYGVKHLCVCACVCVCVCEACVYVYVKHNQMCVYEKFKCVCAQMM